MGRVWEVSDPCSWPHRLNGSCVPPCHGAMREKGQLAAERSLQRGLETGLESLRFMAGRTFEMGVSSDQGEIPVSTAQELESVLGCSSVGKIVT